MNFCVFFRSIRTFRDSCAIRLLVACALGVAAGHAHAAAPAPYPLVVAVGTSGEQSLMVKNAGSTLTGALRHADRGQFWVYGLPVAPGARCRLVLTLDGEPGSAPPAVTVPGLDNKPLPTRAETDPNGGFVTVWTVPDKWPIGGRLDVMLSAKNGPFGVKSLLLAQTLPDSNNDGVPDAIRRLLTEGMPPTTRVTVVRSPTQPFTVTQCSQSVTPTLDVQTDALFVDAVDAATIAAWKARGYAVWTQGSTRLGKEFLAAHRDDVQTTRDGKPVTVGDRLLLSASPAVLAADRSLFDAALAGGSDGACFQEPEYRADAGYAPAFKQAWQTAYNTPWLDPVSTLDARYKASRLMANSVAARTLATLQGVQARKPGARRLVTLHSPLYTAQASLVSPLARLAGLNEVTDIIGNVSVDTAGLPARYAGLRQEMTFARAYLEYSSLLHGARSFNKRIWFLTDPRLDSTPPAASDERGRFEQTLTAALLFPDVSAYQLVLPTLSLTSALSPDDTTRIHSILTALEDMHNQTGVSGNADKGDDIGVLVGDTIQWQREGPAQSDLDGLFGLTLPLLQRGIPIQVLGLDRVIDPGYLNGFKTLLVSYDFQKPLGARTQQALAEWVRRGGSLIYVGGTDAYNGVSDSWWQQAGLAAPQLELWKQLGLNVGNPTSRIAPAEDLSRYTLLLKATAPERNLGNRQNYTVDLAPYVAQTGSVAVRVSSLNPNEPGGAYVASGELAVAGKVAASFTTGSEIENRFLIYDNNSRFNGKYRTTEGSAAWTYQFDNLPRNTPVTLTLDMANSFMVSAASSRPDVGHTLLSTGTNGTLSKFFPRLRIGADYPATLYGDRIQDSGFRIQGEGKEEDGRRKTEENAIVNPQSPINHQPSTINLQPSTNHQLLPLYTLRAGGTPIWMQNVGRGLALNVGIAPGFFSASERSAGLLRALVRFAHQRAGGTYREPGALRLRRGRYTIVRTFAESLTVEGRMIDVLSPALNVADDRIIPPNSVALLYDLGVPEAEPHVGFVSGRLQAKVESSTATTFFVRGAAGTTGVARLHKGNRRLVGTRGMDWLGRAVLVEAQEEGGTVLLRYPNSPDGVILRVGWK